jgi:hypothetical protein
MNPAAGKPPKIKGIINYLFSVLISDVTMYKPL